jgi:hypothetical protein
MDPAIKKALLISAQDVYQQCFECGMGTSVAAQLAEKRGLPIRRYILKTPVVDNVGNIFAIHRHDILTIMEGGEEWVLDLTQQFTDLILFRPLDVFAKEHWAMRELAEQTLGRRGFVDLTPEGKINSFVVEGVGAESFNAFPESLSYSPVSRDVFVPLARVDGMELEGNLEETPEGISFTLRLSEKRYDKKMGALSITRDQELSWGPFTKTDLAAMRMDPSQREQLSQEDAVALAKSWNPKSYGRDKDHELLQMILQHSDIVTWVFSNVLTSSDRVIALLRKYRFGDVAEAPSERPVHSREEMIVEDILTKAGHKGASRYEVLPSALLPYLLFRAQINHMGLGQYASYIFGWRQRVLSIHTKGKQSELIRLENHLQGGLHGKIYGKKFYRREGPPWSAKLKRFLEETLIPWKIEQGDYTITTKSLGCAAGQEAYTLGLEIIDSLRVYGETELFGDIGDARARRRAAMQWPVIRPSLRVPTARSNLVCLTNSLPFRQKKPNWKKTWPKAMPGSITFVELSPQPQAVWMPRPVPMLKSQVRCKPVSRHVSREQCADLLPRKSNDIVGQLHDARYLANQVALGSASIFLKEYRKVLRIANRWCLCPFDLDGKMPIFFF